MKGLIGRKIGMTQVFATDGELIPVSVIEVGTNVVMQKKTVEKDGYSALQLGLEDVKESKATKAAIGHAKKADGKVKRYYREIRSDEMANLEVGAQIKADLFAAGDVVDVTGTSKGKGYMGAVYRNNQTLGPETHGVGPIQRQPGSMATIGRNNGIINKGRIMAGHEGVYTTTNQDLQVVAVDMENGCLLIRGNIPGPRKGLVMVRTTAKPIKHVQPKTLISYAKAKAAEPAAAEAPAAEETKEA